MRKRKFLFWHCSKYKAFSVIFFIKALGHDIYMTDERIYFTFIFLLLRINMSNGLRDTLIKASYSCE